ncbi:MAG: L-glutamate gamma-semialdehyde dehydrogenase [Cyanobacteria bacterium SID2]|nr:L-glutamate gamma-semialdehyde dehydrogenase [Cyanobacteria bacterium SID2]MBP0003339.1 L-glutamate gamma-semialdehyde dehydrogenase [Cyanobacteria bacterium SBC]
MVAQIPKTHPYEDKTQEIARELLAVTREKGGFFAQMRDRMRWDDKLLDWAMSNPGLRVQLFRFIDCLPALRSKAEIARHLQEYLTTEEVELPDALKQLISFSGGDSVAGQLAGTTVATGVETLAYKYIAGENLPKVVKTVERLRKDNMAFTIDLLGEAVITEAEAQQYFDRYLELMTTLSEAAKTWSSVPQIDEADGETLPRVQVSVKLTAFYSQFDPLDAQGSADRVSDRVRDLLRHAAKVGAAIHFDMEQYEYKDLTLSILKKILLEDEFRHRSDIGMTIQAYLRESERDLQGLIDWVKERGTPLTVRLVKGAYWDRETIRSQQHHWKQPVYNDKAATDANFERLTRLLLENHTYIYAAIGSHNVRSQALACSIAETLNIPRRRFEMQVLYGMGDKLAKVLAQRGHRVRVYCPYGELLPGMSYLIRRLLENTANSSFLRQNLENRPVEALISPPKPDPEKPEFAPDALPFPNAADSDYADTALRDKGLAAIDLVRQQLGKSYRPWINGEYVETANTVNSLNPSNPEEVVGVVGQISIEQADLAVATAKAAFQQWRRTPTIDRAAILRKAAELLEQRRHELNAVMVFEVGKPLKEGDAEVSEAIDFCRYYADEMERLESGANYDIPGENNRYHYQPRGITLVISPWNFPLAIPTGMTVASLVAGNCTLLKPAEVSSVIAAKLAEILIEAGIPKGVFQFIPGKGSTVGAHLVKHPDINTIVFTGSQEVGCQIYREAAVLQPGQKHLKRVIAEMGGKNAVIIDESADLDQAVAGVIQSAFGYSGQKCSACSRVVVVESVYDSFVSRVVEAVRSLNVGDASKPSTQVGPVIDAKAQQRIREYIAKGKAEGNLAIEIPSPEPGYFVGPVVLTEVSPDATIAQEEIFGPVLAVLKVKDFDEALTVANSTNYALTGGLYSRTPSHIDRAMAEFEVGNLYINRGITGAIVSRQPFGGFKLSGVGSKAGGSDYVLQFLEPRTITENIQRHGFAPIEGAE